MREFIDLLEHFGQFERVGGYHREWAFWGHSNIDFLALMAYCNSFKNSHLKTLIMWLTDPLLVLRF